MAYLIENISLKSYNTFGIDVKARYLVRFVSSRQILDFLQKKHLANYPRLVLGGGSNVLFTKDYEGVVLCPDIRGIETEEESPDDILLKVGAGEVWDDLVAFTTQKGYAGLENLSDIPGLVGASPVQNIGAYGVEVKDYIEKVRYIDLTTHEVKSLDRDACKFYYRDSIFKQLLKGKTIITHVYFSLKKDPKAINMSYAAVAENLSACEDPSIQDVRDCVIKIRGEKLPDIDKFGNAGSFFKNPQVCERDYQLIKERHPEVPAYIQHDGSYKLSAAWLIEKAGWKGRRKGQVACYERQPLVLVNKGKAKGKDIYDFSREIIDSVQNKFSVTLSTEVNIL